MNELEELNPEQLIERAVSVVEPDERIVAVWLKARSLRDRRSWSDVDLYLAVPDADYESVVADRDDLLVTFVRF